MQRDGRRSRREIGNSCELCRLEGIVCVMVMDGHVVVYESVRCG